jgi:Gram-negative bacterial TonB protein C-terminal
LIDRRRIVIALLVSLLLHAIPAFFFRSHFFLTGQPVQPDGATMQARLQPANNSPDAMGKANGTGTVAIAPATAPAISSPAAIKPELVEIKPEQRIASAEPQASAPSTTQTPEPLPQLTFDASAYLTASQVDQPADMLVPLDASFFTDDLTLSGKINLEIAVNEKGTVDHIEVTDSRGPDGRLLARMLTWLKDKKFNPARKEGKPVPSILSFEFSLNKVENPFSNIPPGLPRGYRPPLDARGNPIWPPGAEPP